MQSRCDVVPFSIGCYDRLRKFNISANKGTKTGTAAKQQLNKASKKLGLSHCEHVYCESKTKTKMKRNTDRINIICFQIVYVWVYSLNVESFCSCNLFPLEMGQNICGPSHVLYLIGSHINLLASDMFVFTFVSVKLCICSRKSTFELSVTLNIAYVLLYQFEFCIQAIGQNAMKCYLKAMAAARLHNKATSLDGHYSFEYEQNRIKWLDDQARCEYFPHLICLALGKKTIVRKCKKVDYILSISKIRFCFHHQWWAER